MKVMVFVEATPNSEAETLFREPGKMAKLLAEMGRQNEELVAGFWIREVKSMEEADLEIRPYYEAADFGEGFTPEEQARAT